MLSYSKKKKSNANYVLKQNAINDYRTLKIFSFFRFHLKIIFNLCIDPQHRPEDGLTKKR